MYRYICLLFIMLLCCLSFAAIAEGEAVDYTAFVRQEAEIQLQTMADEETEPWAKMILAACTVTSVEQGDRYTEVTVTYPDPTNAVNAKERMGDDPAGYLGRSTEPLKLSVMKSYLMKATVSEKNGEQSITWVSSAAPKHFRQQMRNLGKTARASYQYTETRDALESILFPQTVTAERTEAGKVYSDGALGDYGSRLAAVLSLTEEQVQTRFPAFLMLCDATKMAVDKEPDRVTLTVRTRDWQSMLKQAVKTAKAEMDTMLNVPSMTGNELEILMLPAMYRLCLDKKELTRMKSSEYKIVLTDVAANGIAAGEDLLSLFRTYSEAYDAAVEELLTYGASLADYPYVDPIDSCILSEQVAENGATVYFDMGNDPKHHAYLCLMQGETAIEGFVANGGRLQMTLEPGEWEVWCSIGDTWYGKRYLLGKDSFFGHFTLLVEDGHVMKVHLEDTEGPLTVTEVDESEFYRMIGKLYYR